MLDYEIYYEYLKPCSNHLKCNICTYNGNRKTCELIKRIASKDTAINNRQDKNCEIRKTNSKYYHSTLYDLITIANYNESTKDISIMFSVEHIGECPKYISEYEKYEVPIKDAKYISSLKIKLKPIYNYAVSNKLNPLEYYLSLQELNSFTINDLNIYASAIDYYYTSTNFSLKYINNPHKSKTEFCNWDELYSIIFNGKRIFTGNDTKFLARLSTKFGFSRTTLTRLFYYYDDIKYFTLADIEYINTKTTIKKVRSLSQLITIIKKTSKLSQKNLGQ